MLICIIEILRIKSLKYLSNEREMKDAWEKVDNDGNILGKIIIYTLPLLSLS